PRSARRFPARGGRTAGAAESSSHVSRTSWVGPGQPGPTHIGNSSWLRGLNEAGEALELPCSLVLEELRPVVADRRPCLVLAALALWSAERDRAPERPGLLRDRRGRDLARADRVQPLDDREGLPEADEPRVVRQDQLPVLLEDRPRRWHGL